MSHQILAIRFSSLGDLVLTTPLFRAIKLRHPTARITLVTRREYEPLFAQSPRLSQVIGWDQRTPLGDLARQLRRTRWTHRMDLHGSLRSHVLRRMIGGHWEGYPRHRLARAVLIKTKRNIYRDTRPVAERYFDAAKGLDVTPDGGPPEVFVSMEATASADAFLSRNSLGGRTLLGLMPGAAHATKQWPAHHWITLVAMLAEQGLELVILGGLADAELGAQLAAIGGSRVANAAGQFDLAGTAALIKRARCVVAGDTGVMHLATALNVPVVTLLGPTVGAFGFLPYQARATILERALPCRPCTKMGGPVCPLGHHHCLELITPGEVSDALRRLPQ